MHYAVFTRYSVHVALENIVCSICTAVYIRYNCTILLILGACAARVAVVGLLVCLSSHYCPQCSFKCYFKVLRTQYVTCLRDLSCKICQKLFVEEQSAINPFSLYLLYAIFSSTAPSAPSLVAACARDARLAIVHVSMPCIYSLKPLSL